ncbi:MAG: hypothetical protein JNK47_04495 [Mesorhizobium sp.]|nr:hypothetical protein [Mesorhizobium sp.]MBL8576462.1 hypothetical protein [Mesorhizobium sp.]
MRKGLELSESGGRLAAKAGGWRVDLLFPAFLVGATYLIARTFFGF